MADEDATRILAWRRVGEDVSRTLRGYYEETSSVEFKLYQFAQNNETDHSSVALATLDRLDIYMYSGLADMRR